MKYITTLVFLLITWSASAQFSSVSTNLAGWAAGNVNVAVDINVDLHNTINIPVSVNPFKFGDTQWRHVAVQPGWRHWFMERYIGHFISPSLIYANYTIGHKESYYKGNAYGIGFSWGYSILLSTRWNFLMEFGVGAVYAPYAERKYDKYIGEFEDEYTYRHRRILAIPSKCCFSFSYLF